MDAHHTYNEHHIRCMKKAREAEARLHLLMRMHGIILELVRAVQVACVKVVALYGSEIWWNPTDIGRPEDCQLHQNRQGRLILGSLPATPLGSFLRDADLTAAPVGLDSRQQRFVARLPSECAHSKQKELYNHCIAGVLINTVI